MVLYGFDDPDRHLMTSFMPWPMYMTRVQVRTILLPTMLSRHHIHTCSRSAGDRAGDRGGGRVVGGVRWLDADHEVEAEELLVPQLAAQEEHQVPHLLRHLGRGIEGTLGDGEQKATL